VHAVLTASGAQFVTPVTFQALTGNPAWSDQWDARMPNNMAHIDLSRGGRRHRRRAGLGRFPRQAGARHWPTICCRRCAWPATARCWWRRP
jgi:hypothetical protein